LKNIEKIILRMIQVTIGNEKLNLSELMKRSPGNLPIGNLFQKGYKNPIRTMINPNTINSFCIE